MKLRSTTADELHREIDSLAFLARRQGPTTMLAAERHHKDALALLRRLLEEHREQQDAAYTMAMKEGFAGPEADE